MHLKICLDWHSSLLFPSGNAPTLPIHPDLGLLSGYTALTPGWQMLEGLVIAHLKQGRIYKDLTKATQWSFGEGPGAFSEGSIFQVRFWTLSKMKEENWKTWNRTKWNRIMELAERDWTFTRKMCYFYSCHSDPVSMGICIEEESNI